MSETTMPAAEANAQYDERTSYEFAFHILPTVAEGEVAPIYEKIKAFITHEGGELFGEEAPERVDLAYPVVKHFEGKNRKFTSASFGWVRFKLDAEKLGTLMEELSGMPEILRHLLIKLTKAEEARPFRFHENRKSVKMVEVVQEDAELLDESHTEVEESAEVSDEALDESLEKITKDAIVEEKAG